ncbi:Hypothetical predicted protein, partial [Paramuricea clavata]
NTYRQKLKKDDLGIASFPSIFCTDETEKQLSGRAARAIKCKYAAGNEPSSPQEPGCSSDCVEPEAEMDLAIEIPNINIERHDIEQPDHEEFTLQWLVRIAITLWNYKRGTEFFAIKSYVIICVCVDDLAYCDAVAELKKSLCPAAQREMLYALFESCDLRTGEDPGVYKWELENILAKADPELSSRFCHS